MISITAVDFDATPEADPENGAPLTVTTTIYEDIFVNCEVNRGTTSCTTASVVTESGDSTPSAASRGHRAQSAKTARRGARPSATKGSKHGHRD